MELFQTNLIQNSQSNQQILHYPTQEGNGFSVKNSSSSSGAGMRRMRTETPSTSLIDTANMGPTRQELIAMCNQLEEMTWRNWATPPCGNEAKAERARNSFKIERNQFIQNYLHSIGNAAATQLLSELDWSRGYGICSKLGRSAQGVGAGERMALIKKCCELEKTALRHIDPGLGAGHPAFGRAVDAFQRERKELITNYLNSEGSPAALGLLSEMKWETSRICDLLHL
jgi:hypothetical protein